jgi:tRNA(adenine34) deaminase
MTPSDDEFMGEAIAEARLALQHDDVPVGAIAISGASQTRGHNRREVDRDPTAHAEVLALRSLAARLGSWNLSGATLYVTQEPCAMCAGAIVNARVARLVFGCDNPKAGSVRTLYRLADEGKLNHRVEIVGGVRAAECGSLLSDFFSKLRSE